MRALVATKPGGTDVLEVIDKPEPQPTDGEVLVDVVAVGVNFIDVYQREGTYPTPTPFVMCSEGAGVVRGTGERVAWAMHRGSAAAVAAIPREVLVPVPDAIPLETAAASMLQGMTAHYLANSTYPVTANDVCLVHAAAGGVGQLLTQLITAKGATVIATAGTEEKLATARARGAAYAFNYRDLVGDELADAIRRASGGLGVNVAYDGVGKSTFDVSLAALRPLGTLALFGGASGQVPPFELQRLNSGGSLFVTRPSLGHYVATRGELLERARSIFTDVVSERLIITIGGTWPLADAAQAYTALESRATSGKLLLLI